MSKKLLWSDLEKLVAVAVYEQFKELEDEDEQRRFLSELKEAGDQLWFLKDGKNPDYYMPRMGEAYALYYHMRRVDNLYVALNAIHELKPLSTPPRVLDLGAGTGSGAMAVGMWSYKHFGISIAQSIVYSVEPAIPMRRMAYFIMRSFYDKLYSLKEENDMFYVWHPCRATTVEEATWLSDKEKFDIILFCHTFSAETPEYRRRTQSNVLKISSHLKDNGKLIFLTPNIPSKKDLMNEVTEMLIDGDMQHSKLEITQKRVAPTKHPEPIIKVRRFFNEKCTELGVEKVYGETSKMYSSTFYQEDPYYGFYEQCDMFTW